MKFLISPIILTEQKSGDNIAEIQGLREFYHNG